MSPVSIWLLVAAICFAILAWPLPACVALLFAFVSLWLATLGGPRPPAI